MSLEYFSTLAGIAAEVLALVVAFYGAYLVYLRQQRDKYREELVKDFQELDRIISHWSVLEDYTRPPSLFPPTGKYLQILTKVSWKKSPLETLKDNLEELDKIFMETRKKEMEIRSQTQGRLTAGPALYLKVKFAFHDLVQCIYAEFPSPPGDYKISPPPGEIPFSVKSFVRYDFPNNRESFLDWAKRYDIFFKDLHEAYYRIQPIISTLKKVHRESVEQTEKWITELEKTDRFSWAIDSLRESREYSIAEINYYDQIFQFLGKMKHKIDQIRDKIYTYDNYFYQGKWKTVFSFIGIVLTGVFIPFAILFSKPDFPMETMTFIQLFSGVGFGLSTFSAVFLIYRDISKF